MTSDFIHVPKTGGRSVLDACGVKFTVQHKTIQDHIEQSGETAVAAMFKFTTVRNPWDRVFSWWRFFIQGKAVFPEFGSDFDKWVLRRMQMVNQMKNLGAKRPLQQMSYYKDASGVVRIDKFLRFENLTADFTAIAQQVGAVKPIGWIGREDHRRHRGQSLNYRDHYKTQEAIDMVGELNKELIDRFGYSY